jgi:hypothetical protein
MSFPKLHETFYSLFLMWERCINIFIGVIGDIMVSLLSNEVLLRRMRWAGHVTRIEEMRRGQRILDGKPGGEIPVGRSRRRWKDDIKSALEDTRYEVMEWIQLAQDWV